MSRLSPDARAETLVAVNVSHAAKITSRRQTDIYAAVQTARCPRSGWAVDC